MAAKLKVQSFRANDLSESGGKQFEVGRDWCKNFFELNDSVNEYVIPLIFKPLSIVHKELEDKVIELKLSEVTVRGDRKAYANGEKGNSQIKEFFIYDLHLTLNNLEDYFALYKTTLGEYYLYYVPKLLYNNFISLFKTSAPEVTVQKKENTHDNDKNLFLQQIFYGAPGTGKSHRVNEVTEAQPEENVFRTTFHPDSDYSTFVGCYKPTKEPSLQKQPILDYDSLVDKLKEYLAIQPVNITRSCALFGYDYHDSIVKMQEGGGHTIPSLVADAYKSGTTYDSTVRAGMSIYESGAKTQNTSSTITYTFVPQAFTKAYIRAWQTEEPVYLVIEEINRGNCAQIFGDLFQLLDRKNGESEYPIKPDTDLGNFIAEKLSSHVDDAPEKVVNGELMILPKNLYIWATMNTSDQSLFPIDSAFKRRWDWEYIPIANGGKNWKIVIGSAKFDWWRFIEKINSQIGTTTNSEDKKLGYFFCKDKNGIIDEKTFVGKVMFYLWNDVFKDYDLESQLFKDKDGEKLTFDKLYKNVAGQTVVNQDKVLDFLRMLDKTINPSVSMEETEDDTTQEKIESSNASGYTVTKFSLNGGSPMPMTQIAKQVVADYAASHPSENGKQIRDIFNSSCGHIVVETEDEYNERQEIGEKTHGGQELVLANGEKIYTSNQWEWKSGESNFARFIVVVREKGWGDIVEIPTNN